MPRDFPIAIVAAGCDLAPMNSRNLVVALVALAVWAVPSAQAAARVDGSRYAVSFNGTATEDVTWHDIDDPGSGGHHAGTWQIGDPEADVWLPSAAKPAGEGVADGSDLPQAEGATDPAAINDTGSAYGQSWNCTYSTVRDAGSSVMTAGLVHGNLQVDTRYGGADELGWPAFTPRWFRVPNDQICDDISGAPFISYPVGNNALGYGSDYSPSRNGSVGYGASVPLADVGKSGFTLPAEDRSTINQASWGADATEMSRIAYPDHSFAISGNYTFRKLCDGAVTYTATSVDGRCDGGEGKPNTKIVKARITPGRYRARFKLKASGGESPYRFKCKLSRQSKKLGRWRACSSPVAYRHLKPGRHLFSVRAIDSKGVADPSPAKRSFRIPARSRA